MTSDVLQATVEVVEPGQLESWFSERRLSGRRAMEPIGETVNGPYLTRPLCLRSSADE